MTPVEHIQPDRLSPTGNRYTHVIKAGDWVYISGQTASDESGTVVGVGNAAVQAAQVFDNLQKAMESAGGTLGDIIKTTIYVVSRDDVEPVRAVRRDRFGDRPPASTLVIVSGLARPEYLVEIEAVGYLGG
jgi:enamine deaminase RidA (YjgF/YER057c/UK114 family)